MYKLKLNPNGLEINVRAGEMILDAAIAQGVQTPYSCRSGTCRTCLFQVTYGEVEQQDLSSSMLSNIEYTNGRRLICMSVAKSDAILEKPTRRRSMNNE